MKLSSFHPILFVEDSPEDYEITVRAFRKADLNNPIYHCTDGDEALDFLHQRGKYAGGSEAPRPALILLDLNLPGTDGRQVLAAIKNDDGLKDIPVIVMTTSLDARDITSCYQDNVNCYIQKPVDLQSFYKIVQSLKEYWFENVAIPRTQQTH
jgi:CheY-like chemotaxis protein